MHRQLKWVFLTLVLIVSTGCGARADSSSSVGAIKPKLSDVTLSPCPLPSGWATEGSALSSYKQSAPLPSISQGLALADSGNWAYSSLPQIISGPGTYVFDFGPVDSAFNSPSSPTAVSFDSPSDIGATFGPASGIAVVTKSNARYIEVSFKLTGNVPTCSGLVLWAY